MKKIRSALTSIIAIFVLVACAQTNDKAPDKKAKQVILVATDSDTPSFTFKENDEFKGYDIDLLRAIFENDTTYELQFVTVPFSSILVGLDAERDQIGANDFNYNQEREAKYLFSNPISKSNYAVATKDGVVENLDDLVGKSTQVLAGSNYAQVLENWNKTHSDKSQIAIHYVPSETPIAQRLQAVEAGKIDFILYDAISIASVVQSQGLDLTQSRLTGELGDKKDGLEFFVFAKTETGEALRDFVNRRLVTLEKDGRLLKLSQTYFGGDYVSELGK